MKKNPIYTVIYSDNALVVLNKASGILTATDRYDASAQRLDTAANEEFGRLFAVHRIDKETSGLIMYARTENAHRSLSMAFENREVGKVYHALVYGRPIWNTHTAQEKLLADGDAYHRTIVSRLGKDSHTDFTVLGSCSSYTWIEAKPKTGRTHQIRAHLAAQGLSIVCDPLYGGNQKPLRLSEIKRSWRGDTFEERPLLSRLGLHARQLTVKHPESGETMIFIAPYPKDMEAVRKQLEKLFAINPLAAESISKNQFDGAIP